MKIKRIVIATHNQKKSQEMRKILNESLPHLEILTFVDYPTAPEPEETGSTYRENAVIKSESAAKHTGEWCLADDAGLEIDALPDVLGVFSKRFAGEETPFDKKMTMILHELKTVADEKRTARFNCWISFTSPEMETRTFQGVCEGKIAYEMSGSGGFGYDPIFYLPEKDCTMAMLTPEQKVEVSHRGKVLRQFRDWLQEVLESD